MNNVHAVTDTLGFYQRELLKRGTLTISKFDNDYIAVFLPYDAFAFLRMGFARGPKLKDVLIELYEEQK